MQYCQVELTAKMMCTLPGGFRGRRAGANIPEVSAFLLKNIRKKITIGALFRTGIESPTWRSTYLGNSSQGSHPLCGGQSYVLPMTTREMPSGVLYFW
ncbi:hypothetical protein Y1Q_0024535 [Alligator mississippiensis]|uniref:Uncharacterized protein n=1 Tax=Alligator mississippiensis TaxID=8496 RepID=A0A151NAQ6_ALLMI|nr:hypothetical protein Y1Q_0024535 [Alligator mississippiensis]